MSKVDSNFGVRAQAYFKAAKKIGTYVQNADGQPNKSNIQSLKQDVGSPNGVKSNLKVGQANIHGGKFDMTA